MTASPSPNFLRRTRCPACNGDRWEPLREIPYAEPLLRRYLDNFYREVGAVDHAALAGAVYSLQACRNCELVFQRDIPDAALAQRLYEEWLEPQRVFNRYERDHDLQFFTPMARQVESVVRHFGRKPGDLKVLDLGMGWGRWCMFAKAYGCQTYGLEISPARIAYARANGVRVLGYTELNEHTFDMINAEQVFEHLPDPLQTLSMLRACLRIGGLIWIAVPDGADIRRRIARWDWTAPNDSPNSLNAVAPLEHLNCFTSESLLRMAACAGFEPASVLLPAPSRPVATARVPWWRRLGRACAAPAEAPATSATERYFTPRTATGVKNYLP